MFKGLWPIVGEVLQILANEFADICKPHRLSAAAYCRLNISENMGSIALKSAICGENEISILLYFHAYFSTGLRIFGCDIADDAGSYYWSAHLILLSRGQIITESGAWYNGVKREKTPRFGSRVRSPRASRAE